MPVQGKYKAQKIIETIVWVVLASGTIVLLVAAISRRQKEYCLRTNIVISGVLNNFFIDKDDVSAILQKANGGKLEGERIVEMKLASMEDALRKNQWIRNAELFFDNNSILQVRVLEREPVSRIFTTSSKSFYLDTSLRRLPLSDKFSARLPVFTGFPTDLVVLKKKDSSLLREIAKLGEFIGSNPFWMAQIEQVQINAGGTFDLIPKIGNQVIHFGIGEDHEVKFRKLLLFYKQVALRAGWNTYSAINLKYKDQVIAVKRTAIEIKMDSLKNLEVKKSIMASNTRPIIDSTNTGVVHVADGVSSRAHVETSRRPGTPAANTADLNKQNAITNGGAGEEPTAEIVKKSQVKEKAVLVPKVKSKTAKRAKSDSAVKLEKPQLPKAVMPEKDDY